MKFEFVIANSFQLNKAPPKLTGDEESKKDDTEIDLKKRVHRNPLKSFNNANEHTA